MCPGYLSCVFTDWFDRSLSVSADRGRNRVRNRVRVRGRGLARAHIWDRRNRDTVDNTERADKERPLAEGTLAARHKPAEGNRAREPG